MRYPCIRCRANMAHIRQSRPVSGPGFPAGRHARSAHPVDAFKCVLPHPLTHSPTRSLTHTLNHELTDGHTRPITSRPYPLSREHGTHRTVKARVWALLPSSTCRCSQSTPLQGNLAHKKQSYPLQGYLAHKKQPCPLQGCLAHKR